MILKLNKGCCCKSFRGWWAGPCVGGVQERAEDFFLPELKTEEGYSAHNVRTISFFGFQLWGRNFSYRPR